MRMGHFFIALLCLLSPCWSQAKPLVADLSQYRIDIDSSFTGTRLLLFGARNEIGDIVVVVRGPERKFIVRRKERLAGMWMNRRERRFDDVPTFYSLASSRPLAAIPNADMFKSLRIGLKDAVMENDVGDPVFAAALIERLQASHLYSPVEPQKISFMGDSLFKMVIPFPDNIPRGRYSADVYLFNGGELISSQSIPIEVKKTGFDAWVSDFAVEHSITYGALSVFIAVSMGWGASSLMRKI